MGSTSNDHEIGTDRVNGMSENSTFDLHNGFLADIALRRNGRLSFFKHLEVPECNPPPPPTSATDLFQIPENEDPVSANSVPMQLLNLDKQERADLLLIRPKAKIEGNCITAFHYIFVVKFFLCNFMLSQNRVEGVPHPKAVARLLCRLSRVLKSAPSFESDDLSDKFSDPSDYDGWLVEMFKDIEDYIKTPNTPSLPDGYVYIRRGTDTYAEFLVAAATKLNSSSS